MEKPQDILKTEQFGPESLSEPKVLSSKETFEKFIMAILKEGESLQIIDSSTVVSGAEISESRAKARRADISPSPLAGMLSGDLDLIKGESEKSLKEAFRDKIVFDIGAGADIDGYIVAKKLGAACYVAVEPFYSPDLLYRFKTRESSVTIPFLIVNEDGLSALRKLKDNSVSVITSATDDLMLRDTQYNWQLDDELARVIGGKNCFLGYDSILFPTNYKSTRVSILPGPAIVFGSKAED